MGSFANFSDIALLEKRVAHASQQPRPARKYEIDQATTAGTIKGYYWVSIATSYNEAVYPGWWYIIEADHEQGHYFEDSIEPLAIKTSEPAFGREAITGGAMLEALDRLIAQDLQEQHTDTAQSVIHVMTQRLWLSDIILLLCREVVERGYGECLQALNLAGSTLSRMEEAERSQN